MVLKDSDLPHFPPLLLTFHTGPLSHFNVCLSSHTRVDLSPPLSPCPALFSFLEKGLGKDCYSVPCSVESLDAVVDVNNQDVVH